MPLNGRNFNVLCLHRCGRSFVQAKGKGPQISTNGSRADSGSVYIDGIMMKVRGDASSQITPPLDAVQEFMATSGYSAQYGRLSGSVINMVNALWYKQLPRLSLRFRAQ